MKILHAVISSMFFPVKESRNKTSENPLALAWFCARYTYKKRLKSEQFYTINIYSNQFKLMNFVDMLASFCVKDQQESSH